MTNPKTEGLHTMKRWVRIPDGTEVRFCEGGYEGTIDGLTELAMGSGRNPDSRTQLSYQRQRPRSDTGD